ncbi:hypothetical protein RUMOBE_03721 [Blautia obeum ATCC 29174]|uniref:Uncharacterized protein n=1 Tax=Blautia obeum ATCC 29174 TaxID=411459 RepID=A5ZXG8_9FIRM|nr:hypothetical protein RUMOBE_03721 [Blautia obeum ATCC 29174]
MKVKISAVFKRTDFKTRQKAAFFDKIRFYKDLT